MLVYVNSLVMRTGHASEDACELGGALYLAHGVLELKAGATLMLEPECSTMGSFTRHSSGRRSHDLFGSES